MSEKEASLRRLPGNGDRCLVQPAFDALLTLNTQVPRNNAQPPSSLNRSPSPAKVSLISPTPSVEGDDEDSGSDPTQNDEIDLEHEMTGVGDGPQYHGEDTRLTSRKELAGWYSYGWAAEVFAICAIGSFLPITLEQLARDQGVLLKDKTTPCNTSWKLGSDRTSPSNLTLRSMGKKELPACVIYFLGLEINTASFAMYTFSVSVLIQSILIISISGAADHGRFRKSFLLMFAWMGAVAAMLFIVVVPKIYLLGALLAIIANTGFGASFVLLNSFLPVLVRHHPSIQYTDDVEALSDGDQIEDDISPPTYNQDELMDSTARLLPTELADHSVVQEAGARLSPALKLSTTISSNGIGIGYIAGLIVQMLAVLIVVANGSTTFSLRLVLFVVGLWWFIFTVPAAMWLRPRPGPPLPEDGKQNWVGYFTYAWSSLGRTIVRARKLRDLMTFLAAWFLLSDGIATVSGTAILFAKTELGMQFSELGLINVITMVAGVAGAFSWSLISKHFDLRASQTIVICITLFEIIPIYGLLGYIPAIQRLGFLGLQQTWEMYPLGALYGLVLGGLSSYCRSVFGELIPPGFEASFYALYAITDKSSSFFGPTIVGAITDAYGEIRPAFFFLAGLLFCPLPLMLLVNTDRGKAEAAVMAKQLEHRHANSEEAPHGGVPTIHVEEDEGFYEARAHQH